MRPARDSFRTQRAGCTPPDIASLPPREYAYLLGMYLGDGMSREDGSSWTLPVTLDEAYPESFVNARTLLSGSLGSTRIPRPASGGKRCLIVSCTWHPWFLLFPQHGQGRKHHRRIELVDWQRDIVDSAPKPFLRALIHTDGWRERKTCPLEGQGLRGSALPVLQSLRRHPQAVHRRLRSARRRVAPVDALPRVCSATRVSRLSGHLHRTEVLEAGKPMRAEGLEPPWAFAHQLLRLARLTKFRHAR